MNTKRYWLCHLIRVYQMLLNFIRVLSLYHEHPGLWHYFERSLGYYASVPEFGFGFIQAIWNPDRMALHDKIGETIVIKLQKKHPQIDNVGV